MPHDSKGTVIIEDDVITLRCRATNVVGASESGCNVTAIPMDVPAGEYSPQITANTRLFTKAGNTVALRKNANKIIDLKTLAIRKTGPHVNPRPDYWTKNPDGTLTKRTYIAPTGSVPPAALFSVSPPLPSDAGSVTDVNLVWPKGNQDARERPLVQEERGDCWIDACLVAISMFAPWFVRTILHDNADGTVTFYYRTQFRAKTFAITVPKKACSALDGLGSQKETWAILCLLSYCWLRLYDGNAAGKSSNQCRDLDNGFPGSFLSDLGATCINLYPKDINIGTAMLAQQALGMPMLIMTGQSANNFPIPSAHCVCVKKVTEIPGSTAVMITTFNQWGFDGAGPADANPNDGEVTFRSDAMQAGGVSAVVCVTNWGVPAPAALVGDLNLDATVDDMDQQIWFSHLGFSGDAAAPFDTNNDGVIDLLDFDNYYNNVGKVRGAIPALPAAAKAAKAV